MKKSAIAWLIAGTALVLLGGVIFCGALLTQGFDFRKLTTNQYETVEHQVNEEFNSILVQTDTADVIFVPLEGSQGLVECYEEENIKHTVTVKDGTLMIEVRDERKWYQHIGIFAESPKVTVKIPAKEYQALTVETDTGDVEIPKDFLFQSISLTGSTGDVTCRASAREEIRVKLSTGRALIVGVTARSIDGKTSTGDVILEDVTCTEDISIQVTTGDVVLSRVECRNLESTGDTGDLSMTAVIARMRVSLERTTGEVELERCESAELEITTDTGDVELERCDASDIKITTDTGDVEGSLLSPKNFITATDTGRVRVPSSTEGGRCEIKTDTGDIEITVD